MLSDLHISVWSTEFKSGVSSMSYGQSLLACCKVTLQIFLNGCITCMMNILYVRQKMSHDLDIAVSICGA